MNWPETIQIQDILTTLASIVGGYLLGCFATGYYLVRAKTGQDVRTLASGNIGARNVGRVLGRSGFWLTMAGDFAKGALAVLATDYFTRQNHYAMLAFLAVVVGHIWPVQLQFRGGKGVAASFGALVAYDGKLTLAYLAALGVGLILVRRTVLPGLAAFLFLPAASYWLHHNHFEATALATLAALVWLAHRQNLITELPALGRRPLTPKTQQPKP